MILPLHEQVRARVRDALAQLHGITDADLVIPIEYPPNRTLGDLGTPIAFDLARRLRKAPRVIAQELAGALGPMPGIARVDAAPNGYLNVFLDRPAFLLTRLGLAGSAARATATARQDDRRAHGHQPEQGGAYRPPSQLGARRHAGAGPEIPRQSSRGPELHRRHRGAGRGCGRWVSTSREHRSRRREAHCRIDAV